MSVLALVMLVVASMTLVAVAVVPLGHTPRWMLMLIVLATVLLVLALALLATALLVLVLTLLATVLSVLVLVLALLTTVLLVLFLALLATVLSGLVLALSVTSSLLWLNVPVPPSVTQMLGWWLLVLEVLMVLQLLLVLVLALLITSSLLSVVVELLEPLLWLNVLVSSSVTQMLGWWVLVFLLVGEMTDSFVLLLALLKSVVSSLSFLVVA